MPNLAELLQIGLAQQNQPFYEQAPPSESELASAKLPVELPKKTPGDAVLQAMNANQKAGFPQDLRQLIELTKDNANYNKELSSLKSQRGNLANIEEMMQANSKPVMTHPLVAALMGASDIMNGTNNLAKLPTPAELQKQQNATNLQNQFKLQQAKNDISSRELMLNKEHNSALKDAIQLQLGLAKMNGTLDKGDQKGLTDLNNDLQQGWKARSGAMGDVQKRLNAVERSQGLIAQGNMQKGGLDRRQIEELAQSVANLLGGGSQASARVEGLIPATLMSKYHSFSEFIQNVPEGSGLQDFVSRLSETVEREKNIVELQKRKAQVGGLAVYNRLKNSSNPATQQAYNEILQAHGLTPDVISTASDPKSMENLINNAPTQYKPGDVHVENGVKYKKQSDGSWLPI